MMKQIVFFLSFCFFLPSFAENYIELSTTNDFKTTEEILATAHQENSTDCASNIFSNALIEHSDEIKGNEPENNVRIWAHNIMSEAAVLEQVLKCPEVSSVSDTTTIAFTPIVYEFDNGRKITINYSTQPKVLKQKLILSKKRSLPNGDANPQLMDFNDPAKYLNTEPAWYAIMVVQHNSLSEFVGPGKNNTLSMKYLDEHIDEIYPHGYYCTSKTAIANDKDTINQVVHKVVDIEDDSNDYYVAGDKNLEWIMYAEIAADVILTVVTMGGGAFISGSLKGIRATKTGLRLTKNMNKLKKFRNVEKYIKSTEQIENINRYQKILKDFEKAQKSGKDVSKLEKELQETFKMINRADKNITEVALKDPDKAADILKVLNKNIDDVTDVSKQLKEQRNLLNEARKKADPHKIKDYDNALKEIETLRDAQTNGTTISRIKDPAKKAQAVEKYNEQQKRIEELEKILKDYENSSSLGDYPKLKNEVDNLESVEKYIKQSEELEGILKYHNSLNAFRRPQTGNIITRNLKKIGAGIKSIRAAKDGAKAMTKAGNVARAGMSSKSAKIKSWLMDNTLKHGARLGMATNKIGEVYGLVTVAKFLGDMYDQTSNTSSEFSNGIEFKPFCLLSADDLEGQENVVNYGMWLMWVGNSTDENDDDAAYLQAMDFASKFYYQLDEFQDENTPNCNVDIYVVRPIIRLDETNMENPSGELFYLFMNDIPWSTAEQFGDKIENIEDWERTQITLQENDPENKNKPRETVVETPEEEQNVDTTQEE